MKELRETIHAVPPLDPKRPVIIPWETEAGIEKKRRDEGIPIQDGTFEPLKGLTCGQYEYEMPKA